MSRRLSMSQKRWYFAAHNMSDKQRGIATAAKLHLWIHVWEALKACKDWTELPVLAEAVGLIWDQSRNGTREGRAGARQLRRVIHRFEAAGLIDVKWSAPGKFARSSVRIKKEYV